MKICVFGAGAVGSHVATRLAEAKRAEVSVVGRGAQLEAIRRNGFILKSGGREFRGTPAAATDDPSSLPPQDVVIVTLKAHAVPALATMFDHMLSPSGVMVFMLNGIPWWWNEGLAGKDGALPLLDPERVLWDKLRKKTLGCVIYSPNELEAPGVVIHVGANKWLIGEPRGETTPRLTQVIDLLNASGLVAEIPRDLRAEIWRKLVNNASASSLAALTRLTLYEMSKYPELIDYAVRIIRETLDVAAALGWDLRKEVDVAAVTTRGTPGSTKPSMLQDVLIGRGIEVEALLGQTQAFAREAGIAVPTIDSVVPLLRGLDQALRVRT